jgi:hemolysin-activating ACP:hemolysin acyltransferase
MQDIVELFRNFKRYDSMNDNQLRLYLMPSISLGQCKKFYDGNKLVGFVNWAYIHNLTEQRFKKSGKIMATEWKSGNNLWLVEIVSIKHTFKMMRDIYNYFKKKMNIDQSINWLRTNSNIYRVGKKHKREFHV